MSSNQDGLMSRVLAAVVLLIAVAYGARWVYELLRPLIGGLVVLAVLLAVLGFVVRRHRRW